MKVNRCASECADAPPDALGDVMTATPDFMSP